MTREDDLGEAATVPESGGSTPGGATKPSSRGVMTVEPGVALGRYVIEEEIGAGGMAAVFRARDPQLRREVAVKVMFPHLAKKPEIARRFQREARAAAGLEHPNILRVYDVGGGRVEGRDVDEPPYIVMELVRGKSLREVGEGGAILGEVVACMGALLCDALAAAHAAGVIHRDVKPGNVMVTEDGRLLLADFGVARVDDDDSLVTKTGALLGTPSFMSPEQAGGDQVDGRSDLYSVGATLYQLATGSAPFSGPTAVVVAAILKGELTPPERRAPSIGPDLARAIKRLMALAPAGRPADAHAAASLLREVVSNGGFGDPREELALYLRDPKAFEAERRPRVVARTVERARAALADNAIPRAIGLVDRVLAMEPAHPDGNALLAQIGRGDRRRRVVVVGACVAAIASIGGIGFWMTSHGSSPPDASSPFPLPLPLPLPDAKPAAPSPDAALVPPDATPASHHPDAGHPRPHLTPDAAVAILAPPPDAARPRTPPDAAPPPPARGSITVSFDAWCDLSIDGTSVGRADPHKSYPLDAGTHALVCTQGQGLPTWSGTTTVISGLVTPVSGHVLASVRVKVSVTSGDSVRIGGDTYANGAAMMLKPGRIRVEVLKGGNVVTTGWVSLPRIAGCALQDQPDLDCYP